MLSYQQSESLFRPISKPLAVRSIEDKKAFLSCVQPQKEYWAHITTPSWARLLFGRGEEFMAGNDEEGIPPLTDSTLQEIRFFNGHMDLRWLDHRGVLLTTDVQEADKKLLQGADWLERKRSSRLWGSWLESAEGWFEERIPDPQKYGNLKGNAEQRFVSLRYREYIRDGRVEYVRFLSLELKGAEL